VDGLFRIIRFVGFAGLDYFSQYKIGIWRGTVNADRVGSTPDFIKHDI